MERYDSDSDDEYILDDQCKAFDAFKHVTVIYIFVIF